MQPWRGCGPLSVATTLGKMAGLVEEKMAEDLSTPTAHILPTPAGIDGGDNTLAALRADIGAAKGAVVMAESTFAGGDDGRASGTKDDWRSRRMGPEIPDNLRVTWKDISAAVASACGIPSSLTAASDADGTQLREDYRRYVMTSVQPVADMIAMDASGALDAEVGFDFTDLWAHDLAGRATAFQRLVAGGLAVERAVQHAGLMVGE